ncbi:hypothetical protein V1264_025046 [Littorina saxatilis]|uniref:Uncharacterized protein n=1 Tax=Littorina saxatilis TaxID=31220 RepID=A0AAN9FXY1_9CAEN
MHTASIVGLNQISTSVAYAGKYDIERHCSSKTHLDKVATKKSAESCQGIIKFIPTKLILPEEKAVVRAEAMFSEMIVKMNLPLSTACYLTKFIFSLLICLEDTGYNATN